MVLSSWLTAGRACSRSSLHAYTALGCGRAGLFARRLQSTAAAVKENTGDSVSPQTTSKVAEDVDAPEFESLRGSIDPSTLRALTGPPFRLKTMTSVQAAIAPLLPQLTQTPKEAGNESRDLLVRAKTGTGKTLAFLIPALEGRLRSIKEKSTQIIRDQGHKDDKQSQKRFFRAISRAEAGVLILSPTRELASQIAVEAQRLTTHHDGMEVRLFVGGESKKRQMRQWMQGTKDIIVATPGRLRDIIENEPDFEGGLSKIGTLILDECDTLLDMGFRDDIDRIVDTMPSSPDRQTFLFSATLNRAVRQAAERLLAPGYTSIDTVGHDDSPVHAHIPQYHTILPSASEQIPHLVRLISHDQLVNPGQSKIIVFCSTTKLTQMLSRNLKYLSRTFPVRDTNMYEIHSKKEQSARSRTSDLFRKDKHAGSVLVTSDVSARGVDYPGVTRVIQLGIPSSTEQYIHRVGRTGRAGARGRGDLVLLPWEIGFVSWQLTNIPLKPVTTTELTTQLEVLAEKFDTNPEDVLQGAKVRKDAFQQCVLEAAQGIPHKVKALHARVNKDEVEDTLAAFLGFYATRDGDLRVSRGVILEGLKDWVREACGLQAPPYLSENFLARLGYGAPARAKFSMASSARGWDKLKKSSQVGSRRWNETGNRHRDEDGDRRPSSSGGSGRWNETESRHRDEDGDRRPSSRRGSSQYDGSRTSPPWTQRGNMKRNRERTIGEW